MVLLLLHVVCGLLLVLSGSRGAHGRCLNEVQMNKQWSHHLSWYSSQLQGAHTCHHRSEHNLSATCNQTIKDMKKESPTHEKNQRSVSPWTYLLDQDENRIPPVLSRAQCLCEGCILQGKENQDYNSVPVCANMMVLRRDKCPNNDKKYMIKKELISIPVACICVEAS